MNFYFGMVGNYTHVQFFIFGKFCHYSFGLNYDHNGLHVTFSWMSFAYDDENHNEGCLGCAQICKGQVVGRNNLEWNK